MRAYWTLTRRELSMYFLSLTGYIMIAASVFLLGLGFVILLKLLQKQPTAAPLTEMFYMTTCFWLILLLLPPLVTMRLFALEKFSGTFETLMTAPVTDAQVVFAKFTAAFVFYVVMWLPLVGCLFVVQYLAQDRTALDLGEMGSTFLGIFLLGGLFISLGCCASALTRSQVVAAMISMVFGASIFYLSYLADQLSVQTTWQGQVLSCFAMFQYMQDFSRGVVDTRPVVLLVSLTLFFLFLTLRVVESRRWK